jgi:hypothetical protein
MKKIFFSALLFVDITLIAQFAPPAEQEGTTAIRADSNIFVAWAEEGIVQQSWMDISDTLLGKVSYGEIENIFGIADNNTISLGDGGIAKIHFDTPIIDGEGYDFAVFENSFSDDFLELAFIEVSSDGQNYFRFSTISNTQTDIQIGTFGIIDATKINNFAGKYRAMYGTPFDLDEMKDIQGLDIMQITDIKIIDVIGSINLEFATYDSQNQIINDPYPTSFASGGFDLDAIGAIHDVEHNGIVLEGNEKIHLFPNPITNVINIDRIPEEIQQIEVYSIYGVKLFSSSSVIYHSLQVDVSRWAEGVYFVKFVGSQSLVRKIIKN